MPGESIRIISDVHYGDRASLVRDLAELRPLSEGIDRLILNGDSLDTRPGPHAEHTHVCRLEWRDFANASAAPVVFLTGNHDPDISDQHWLDVAGGVGFAVHGDLLFDDIVPWGRDARIIRKLMKSEGGTLPWSERVERDLHQQAGLWRRIAGSLPQRHQSERNPLKYALHFAVDTVWPPTRMLKIFEAWRTEPHRAVELARRHRPNAQFIVLGHTHRPRIRPMPGRPTVINTGSFTAPFGGYAVDFLPDRVRVRRILRRARAFHLGPVVAELPIAPRSPAK